MGSTRIRPGPTLCACSPWSRMEWAVRLGATWRAPRRFAPSSTARGAWPAGRDQHRRSGERPGSLCADRRCPGRRSRCGRRGTSRPVARRHCLTGASPTFHANLYPLAPIRENTIGYADLIMLTNSSSRCGILKPMPDGTVAGQEGVRHRNGCPGMTSCSGTLRDPDRLLQDASTGRTTRSCSRTRRGSTACRRRSGSSRGAGSNANALTCCRRARWRRR